MSQLRTIGLAVLATGALVAAWASSAQAYVYWTSNGPNYMHAGTTLDRADLDGTGVDNHFVTGATEPGEMIVGGGHVYWANANAIGMANLDGSGANPTLIPGVFAAGLAVDGSYLYWTDSERYIGRAKLDGSDPQPKFIDLGTNSFPSAIAIGGGTIYVAVDTGTASQIDTVASSGGKPAKFDDFSSIAVSPTAFAVAGGYLYFSAITNVVSQQGEIGSVALTGGPPDESLVTNLRFPYGVATDGTYLYWTDAAADTIGRALITSSGISNIQTSFLTDPNGPWGIAVDAGIDPTTTSVSCLNPTVAPGATVPCTAKVTDTASTSPPAGTVNFNAGASAPLIGNPCMLGLIGGVAQCTVSVQPATAAHLTIAASYSGDPVHQASSGSGALCAGTALQCNPPPRPACVVPKLKGKSLARARAALTRAHCRLGKVARPKHAGRHAKLVVGSSRPKAGTKLADSAKVSVKLVAAPSRHRQQPH